MACERCGIQQPSVSFGLTSRPLPPALGENPQNRGEILASIPGAAAAKAAFQRMLLEPLMEVNAPTKSATPERN